MIEVALAFAAGAAGIAALGDLAARRRRDRAPWRTRAPVTLLAAQLGGAAAGAAAGLFAGALLPGKLALLAALAGPPAGFAAPAVRAAQRRVAGIAEARRDLPALLDLLRVGVEAGASLPHALADVARRSHTPLAGRWGAVAAQVEVGVPLAAALERHRRELPIPEIDAFAAALVRATRHGAPLGDTLAALARDVRLSRRREVQERAARAAPKMQLVVALLLVPSVMLLVAAALLSALARGGGAGITGI